MSVNYTSILWNAEKKRYDRSIFFLVASFLILFYGLHLIFYPSVTFETILIRAFGWTAILLLHVILIIGPLARIKPAFHILLYNRRHLGVAMFFMGLIHGGFSIIQFHSLGNMNPIRSIFMSNLRYGSILFFPFQTLGFLALVILALMAASSHDFWLKNLGIKVWKGLHCLVYIAYGLLLMHIVLGGLQNETSPAIFSILLIGFMAVGGLHVYAGFKEFKQDKEKKCDNEFIPAGKFSDIKENRAKILLVNGERVAIYKYDGKLSAISNVCRHQGGPLGEGKIIDGCITCPWHGYQYLPENGQSPPPFTEKVETYNLKIEGEQIFVDPKANAPGTYVKPITLS